MSAANCHQTEPGAGPGLVVIPVQSLCCCHYLENNVAPALSQDSQCWALRVVVTCQPFHGCAAPSAAFWSSVSFFPLGGVAALNPGTLALDDTSSPGLGGRQETQVFMPFGRYQALPPQVKWAKGGPRELGLWPALLRSASGANAWGSTSVS